MKIFPIQQVIPENNIIVFSPHYDDVLFMLGGYILELKKAGLMGTKHFHINLIFSRSNYQVGTGEANFDPGIERIKFATGNRIIEDQDCNNELIGEFNYVYQIIGEKECFVRGKEIADCEMEFPHGMYEDFTREDELIFERMKQRIRDWAMKENTALVFPMAIKEHLDHFITREAAIFVAKELGEKAKARFYFQEDKPYGGLATEEELLRVEDFVKTNRLESRLFTYEPQEMIDLAFKHYISQVEDVYKKGILARGMYWMDMLKTDQPLDRITVFN